MTAKEYLQEIKKLDTAISQKQFEYDSLKKQRVCISGFDYSTERARIRPDKNVFEKVSDRKCELQKEIIAEIDRYHDMRHERINQIQYLSKEEYTEILFRRYVMYETFETISLSLHRSYYWVCHLHGEALKEFENEFLKDSK